MDSPAPFLVAAALVAGLVYQVGFRYEHWVGGANREVTYERDNLTGETHTIRPGEKLDFFSRLLGNHKVSKKKDHDKDSSDEESENPSDNNDSDKTLAENPKQPEAFAFTMVEAPLKDKQAEITPPVPTDTAATKQPSYVVKDGMDLNGDGSVEQVIQNKTADDGLLDISIVSGGRELFYSRGTKLQVLPAKHSGWSDLALTVNDKEKTIYRFSPEIEGYQAQ